MRAGNSPYRFRGFMMALKEKQQIELLRYLLLNRLVEDRLSILYRQGKILGGLYLSRGQEAISVGTAYALGPDDVIGPMIRNMGALFVRGLKPRDVFLQYLGRAESPTGGRENAHHIGDLRGRGIVAPISMLGKMISILMGISMSFKLRGEKRVALNYIGEGGASTGDFHEALNMAGVFKLPFILIVENNQFAYSTPVSHQTAAHQISDRAAGYGIHGEVVDGNDVIEVYEATVQAAKRARAGEGPSLIECMTMRMKGHAEHDDARYVPSELFGKWEKRDPIGLFKKKLLKDDILTGTEIEAIEEEIKTVVEEDVEYALNAPMPEGRDAARGVYAEPLGWEPLRNWDGE
jgi:TPP-dependent pyruvate/acetoin dehydrogenase alpha subunit